MNLQSMSETCILCDDDGTLTPEHIWPDWYSKMRRGIKYGFEGEIAGHPQRIRRLQKFNLAPEVLCLNCNGVWGSQLEKRVAKFLKPMVDGTVQTLSLADLRRLAAWAELKFMVSEYLNTKRPHFYSDTERHYLRQRGRPPRGANLWVGRYVGAFAKTGRLHDDRSIIGLDGSAERYDAWSANLTIGQVVIQLFALERPEDLDRLAGATLIDSRSDWHEAMVKIWPIPQRPFNWPPPRTLDDRGFGQLKLRWQQPDAPRAKGTKRKRSR